MHTLVLKPRPVLSAPCSSRRSGAALASSTCCAYQQQQLPAELAAEDVSRRRLAISASVLLLASQVRAAHAEATQSATAVSPAASSSSTSSSAPSPDLEPFLDNEYQLQVPSNYHYLETPIVRVERGPQPERSPVLARFESPNPGPEVISVVRRKASALKQTLLQVGDISQLGDPTAVASLLLPPGSRVLASAVQQVPQPPKETPLGPVEVPAQTYYTAAYRLRYEFTTPNGFHVALAAAAKKGTVLICGASTTAAGWPSAGPVFKEVVKSFRLRSQAAITQS